MTPTKESHKQNPLANWLSAKQWAGERGDLSKSKRRIWMQAFAISYPSNDPLWPLLQLVSLSPNPLIAEIWEPRMQQRGQSINLPQETSGQQHVSLTLGQNCKRWNLWFGLNASCGPTRSCLPNLANKLGAFAGREGVSTSVSRRSWCECSNLSQLEVLELTQMNFGEKLQELLFDGQCSSDEWEIPQYAISHISKSTWDEDCTLLLFPRLRIATSPKWSW